VSVAEVVFVLAVGSWKAEHVRVFGGFGGKSDGISGFGFNGGEVGAGATVRRAGSRTWIRDCSGYLFDLLSDGGA
jgi:hypothetical protein